MAQSATKSLLLRLAKGEEAAFREIYEQYWSRLYALCMYYTGSKEETEDLLTDLFVSLWKNKAGVQIEQLDAYLVRAAKNQCLKYLQRKYRRQAAFQQLGNHMPATVADFDWPDRQLEFHELSSQLDNQIKQLPEKTKMIFLLNRDTGLTYDQIARSLNISTKTVEYHISKALKLLASHALLLITALLIK